MEVRKRLLALAAVVVTMTIVTSADSSVVDLTQLLEGADRTRRQLTACSVAYPAINPCQIGRTQDRFAISSAFDMFIQCSDNTMYLTFCPPSQPYFNHHLQDCSAILSLARSVESIAASRTNRQTPTCSFQYPARNPCLQIGRTQDRFPYPSSPDMFIQCSSQNTMYLTICPPSQPYYDESHQGCSTTIATGGISSQILAQCQLSSDPCTSENLNILNQHAFTCVSSPTRMYLQCDAVGIGHIVICSPEMVFSQPVQSCIPRPDVSPVWTESPGLPIGIAVSTNHEYPCTAANIASQLLRHPYGPHAQYYILCNEWGTGYLETCEPLYFDSQTSSCGPIVGRK